MSFKDGLEEIAYSTLLSNREALAFNNVSKEDECLVAHRFISYLFSDFYDPLNLQRFESNASNCHFKYSEYFRELGYVVKQIPFSNSDQKLSNGQVILAFSSDTGSPYVVYNINGLKPRIFDCSIGKQLNASKISLSLSTEALLLLPSRLSKGTSFTQIFEFGSIRLTNNFVILGLCLLLAAVLGLAYPIILSVLIQTAIPQGLEFQVYQLSLLFFGLSIAFIISEFASIFVFIFLDTVIDVRVQVATYERLFNLPLSFFSQYRSGDLMSRAQAITQIRALLSGSFIDTVVHSSTLITSIVVLIVLSWKLSIVVIIISLIYFAGTAFFGYFEAKTAVRELRLQGINIGFLFNIIKSFAPLNSENRIGSLVRQYESQLQKQLQSSFATDLYKACADTLDIILKSLGLFAIFLFGHIILKDSKPTDFLGGFNAGKFVAFVSIYSAYIASIYKLTRSLAKNGSTSLALWNRALPIFQSDLESSDESYQLTESIKEVIFNDVYFKYPSQKRNLFENLSLKFVNGDVVGITGDVSSGKTSFFDLILGFNKPQSGAIEIDSINVESLNHNVYRAKIGVITQNREIIPGFLKDFLLNGGEFTESEVETVLTKLGSYEEYKRYPLGLNTPLAYNGYNFTSTFRENLLLTRALIKPVDIFIADDSILSSDPTVIDTIKQLSPGVIIFIATTRKELLERCTTTLNFSSSETGLTSVVQRKVNLKVKT